MNKLPESIVKLIDSFKALPGIGAKSAERLAYYIIERNNHVYNKTFAQNLLGVIDNIKTCDICFFFVEDTFSKPLHFPGKSVLHFNLRFGFASEF